MPESSTPKLARSSSLQRSLANVITLLSVPDVNIDPHTGVGLPQARSHAETVNRAKTDPDLSAKIKRAKSVADLYDEPLEEDKPEPTAEWHHAAFSTMAAMVGTSVLGLPKSFAYLTWPGGIIALTLAYFASVYTGFRLASLHVPVNRIYEEAEPLLQTSSLKDAKKNMRLNTYQAIGENTLGPVAGKWVVVSFQQVLLGGISCAYLLVAGLNIQSIYRNYCTGSCPNIHRGVFTAVIAVLEMLLFLLPTLKVVRLLSQFGIICSLLSCITQITLSCWILAAGTATSQIIDKPYSLPGDGIDSVMGVFLGLSAVAFTFGAKAFQPELQASLANEPCPVKAMKKSILLSYTYAFLVFMLCACTGYAAFGNTVDGNILTSIRNAATNPAQRGLATFAQVLTTIQVVMAFQIVGIPVEESMRSGLLIGYARFWDRIRPKKMSVLTWNRVVMFTFRCAYVILVMVIAIVIPGFDIIMGLLGSICTVPVDFVLPLVMYMKTHWRQLTLPIRALDWTILSATFTIGVLGIIGTIYRALKQSM